MSAAAFDKKFGADLVSSAPTAPGVYRYLSEDGSVIYVGKAKSLRRRLASYRNASRKKVHRKMRTLVRAAHSLVYETCESEEAALLRESELIRELRPAYNVDGAYAFLYPSLGLGSWDKHTLLCFTTQPEQYAHLGLSWYGCFRSRPRVKLAFSALVDLLSFIGHKEKATRLPEFPRIRGSRVVGVRQLPNDIAGALPEFFAGRERTLPSEIARRLLARHRALKEASKVESDLKSLMEFYQADAARLREALRSVGRDGTYVSQEERDSLFIRAAAHAGLGVFGVERGIWNRKTK